VIQLTSQVSLLSPELFAQFVTQGLLMAPFSMAVKGRVSYWVLWTKESANAHFVTWMKSEFGIAGSG
jgi:hypothetical protein